MEKINRDDNYLIQTADKAISELVYDKLHLIKAYNYYMGVRDRMQFKHLEENYGLGNPTSVTFTPLIRKHIDSLVGEFLTLPIKPKISCKDSSTLNNIFREKQLQIAKQQADLINGKLSNLIYSLLKGDGKNKIDDSQFSIELQNIKDSVDENFISNYEKSAQNIIEYLLQSRNIDFKNKLKMLILDLFITGEMYYLAEPTSGNTNINLKVLNPLNVFPDQNVDSPYINDSYRIVYREYLSKPELLIKYGRDLSNDDIEKLDSAKMDYSSNNIMLLNTIQNRIGCFDSDGLEAGMEVTPVYNNAYPNRRLDLYVVDTVQWIDYDFDKDKNRIEHRYKVVRIGQDMHILYGVDDSVVRDVDSPNECKLSINGLQYKSRTGKPYSLILATADLQDKYDLLHFAKDNIIAQSGTAGDFVDIAFLPQFLGSTIEERLVKWLAYKKSGIALMDSSVEGQQMSNTFVNGFDDTVKLQAIQAIELAIQDIENTAMSITGVTRERIGGIQPRDAVKNVEIGVQQSAIVTKQYYHSMDLILREMLLDSLNVAKIVYKNGLTGTLILGDGNKKLFTSLPEYFTMTSYDIHLKDSSEAIKEKSSIQELTMELAKVGAIDPDVLVNVATSESLTEMKLSVQRSIEKKKQENDKIQQLSQQLQQAQQQMQQMQQQLQEASKKVQQLDEQKLSLEKEKINKEYEVGMAKVNVQKQTAEDKGKNDKRRVELEALQLIDNNKQNDEVRDE